MGKKSWVTKILGHHNKANRLVGRQRIIQGCGRYGKSISYKISNYLSTLWKINIVIVILNFDISIEVCLKEDI